MGFLRILIPLYFFVPALLLCLRMIFSEKWYRLFGIILEASCRRCSTVGLVGRHLRPQQRLISNHIDRNGHKFYGARRACAGAPA
jgi:hypothetical protein